MNAILKKITVLLQHNLDDDRKYSLSMAIIESNMMLLLHACLRFQSVPKLINFYQFVSNLDVKDFLQDNIILPCDCAASSFTDRDHQRLFTGDSMIVGSSKLKKLFNKCSRYRETNNISWDMIV